MGSTQSTTNNNTNSSGNRPKASSVTTTISSPSSAQPIADKTKISVEDEKKAPGSRPKASSVTATISSPSSTQPMDDENDANKKLLKQIFLDAKFTPAAPSSENPIFIAQGGSGSIHKYTGMDGKELAVKSILIINNDNDPGYNLALENEFKSMQECSRDCSHIVKVFSKGFSKDYFMYTMEYCPFDLNTLLHEPNKIANQYNKKAIDFPLPGRLTVALHIATALARIHSLGYIHLDVKSENVLINSTGELFNKDYLDVFTAKLTDFGLCSKATNRSPDGSGAYMAPEIVEAFIKKSQNVQLSPAADIYSFGILLLEIISKGPAQTFTEALLLQMQSIIQQECPEVSLSIVQTLKILIQNCCEQIPEKRPDAEAICSNLRQGIFNLMASSSITKIIDTPEECSTNQVDKPLSSQGLLATGASSKRSNRKSLIVKSKNDTQYTLPLPQSSNNHDGIIKKAPSMHLSVREDGSFYTHTDYQPASSISHTRNKSSNTTPSSTTGAGTEIQSSSAILVPADQQVPVIVSAVRKLAVLVVPEEQEKLAIPRPKNIRGVNNSNLNGTLPKNFKISGENQKKENPPSSNPNKPK